MKVSKEELSYYSQNIQTFGIDEAGRGAYAGPLSVAVVSYSFPKLEKVFNQELLKGLNDSKQVSENKRILLYGEILQIADFVRHCFVSPKFIDQFGISYSFLYAVNRFMKNIDLDNSCSILIDGRYNLKNFPLKKQIKDKIQFKTKGDERFISIASASIIAKVKRDNLMRACHKKYPHYEFEKNKGYGVQKHEKSIRENGLCKIHRKTFTRKFYNKG